MSDPAFERIEDEKEIEETPKKVLITGTIKLPKKVGRPKKVVK